MEDHHDAVLELGGEVEGEPGPRQTGPRRRDPLQHIVHDVDTARASVALGHRTARYDRGGRKKQLSPGVFDVDLEEIPARNSDGLCGNQPATHTAMADTASNG